MEAVARPGKIGSLEAVARPEKIGKSEAVARPEKIGSLEAVVRPEKIPGSEAVERPEPNGMRIYWKADPPESGEGGRKRTASRWYRTRHPDRVLPKEAVVP